MTIRTSTGTEGSLLIASTIYDELIPEYEKKLIPRDTAALVFGPTQIKGSSINVNLEVPDAMKVNLTAEGTEIQLETPEYVNVNIVPQKYGLRINITMEMMEDEKFALLPRAARLAGKRLAENENSLILTALDGAANTVTGGTEATIGNFTQMILNLENADAEATDCIMGNEVARDLRLIDTFIEADKAGTDEALRSGRILPFMGMRVHRFSTNAAPTTAHARYAYVLDREHAYAIAEKRPVTMRMYTIETHDTDGVACTQRVAVSLLRSDAVSRLTTT